MNVDLNPEMITLGRESRGFSQTELGEKIGVKGGYFSKVENGILSVTEERFHQICDALRYPPSFFFQADRTSGQGSPCLLYHRKRQSMPILKLRQIQAKIRIQRLALLRLLRGVELTPEVSFQRFDIDEYGSPQKIARLLRVHWRLPHGPIRNLVQTVETAGGIVLRVSFETRKLDGVSEWPRGAPPLFFLNEEIPVDRWRWTLAHEIGHLVMHTIPSDNQEKEADQFAAEFLMPQKEIQMDLKNLTLPRAIAMKPYWKVSVQGLIRHAYTLGQITERQYRRLMVQMSQMGYRKYEPQPLPPEQPTLLQEIIRLHQKAHGYSFAELSQIANLREEEFRHVFIWENHRPNLRSVN